MNATTNKFSSRFLLPLLAFFLLGSTMVAAPVAYSGKLAVNGINLDGTAQLSFALRDANGTVHWRNGNDANATIAVPVDRGHYLVLLGGQGMNPLPSDLFLDHPELYLQVRIGLSGNSTLLHLTPDRRITASPHALSAEVARNALVADLAKAVQSGAVTREMLSPTVLADLNGTITRSRLAADVLADLNRTINVTRNMLPGDVLADINATITRSRLAADILADLNATISRSRIAADVLADLNATITRSRLAADVLADLNRSIAAGSVTRGMLAAGVQADLNASLSAASVTAANIHPDLVKYFLPEISAQLVSSAGLKGTNVTLSLSASGKFLSYQWKKNGVNLSGENNATLVFTDANASLHDGNYSVVVSNDWGSVSSNIATFTVATNTPVIILEGNASVTHEGGVAYVDPGATASDALNGNLTAAIVVTGSVDVNETGQNQIKYNVADAGGNVAAEKVRNVTVVDTTPPVISLIGDANFTHTLNTAWNDPGVAAVDTLDGNLSTQVAVAGAVDVNSTGTYVLTYNVSDQAGNAAPVVTRGVQVLPLNHAVLTGTPNPATVFNTIDQTYFFKNNLSNVIWHKASGKILSGHYGSPGYWSFTAGTSGYPESPNNTPGGSFARMVQMPAQNVVVYNTAGGHGAIPHDSIYIADIDSSTGLLNNRSQASFSDNFSGSAKLSSSSANEFIFFDGSGIRHYSVTNGSNVLTFVKTVSLSQAPTFGGTSHSWGGTFAWDGMYYYFTKAGSGTSNLSYDVFNGTGTYVNSYTASGSGTIHGVYFDWSVGRYSTHDGVGNRSGGTTHTWSGGSGNDSHNFSPVSSAHTTPEQ